ncbi:MAG: hypothetical protein WCD70_11880 [Alphaproteobacteria bacterium]
MPPKNATARYLPLGSEFTAVSYQPEIGGGIAGVGQSERLVVVGYHHLKTEHGNKLCVEFAIPDAMKQAVGREFHPHFFERFRIRELSGQELDEDRATLKFALVSDLRALRVAAVKQHSVASNQDFEMHALCQNVLKLNPWGVASRINSVSLYKHAGQRMLASLRGAVEDKPIRFGDFFYAAPGTKKQYPCPPENFKMTVLGNDNAPT